MNPYFFEGDGRRDYPARSYAKLEQIEPPNAEGEGDILFAFDAVDADWRGFEPGEIFSLDAEGDERRSRFWAQRFAGGARGDTDEPDPFDKLPMYRIELTLPRHDMMAEKLLGFDNRWLEIELGADQGPEVDVFGGLFTEPVPARMTHMPQPAPHAAILDRLFDMDDWPDASEDELTRALAFRCRIEQLLVFDVGQGSANALVCQCGIPLGYFDVGCGVYRNMKTRPPTVSFCTCEPPVVILSHWDADHWAGAMTDRKLLAMTWITPRQSISTTHKALGNYILKAGGRLLIIPPTLPSLAWHSPSQSLELRRCTGTDRNGSGLALIAADHDEQRAWLLTGDAGYQFIPPPLPGNLSAIVVPHHGADMGAASSPPAYSHLPYSRLAYSFGPGNAHGRTSVSHPTAPAVAAHVASGWPHGLWMPPPPALQPAGAPVVATASHGSTHHGGIAIGWSAAPDARQIAKAHHCAAVMPITQS